MSKLQLKIFLKKSYEFSLVLFQFFIIILHFIHLEFIPKKEIMQVNFFFSFVGFLLIIISTIVMLISIKDLGRNLSPFPRPIVNGNLTTSGIYSFIRHPMYYSLILISFGFFITKLSFYYLFLTITNRITNTPLTVLPRRIKHKVKVTNIYRLVSPTPSPITSK